MKIGFIGLGTMGSRMAQNLAKAGYNLHVFDVNKDAARNLLQMGVSQSTSEIDVATEAEVLFTSLPTPAIIENAAFGTQGFAAALKPGSVWFDLSTSSLKAVRSLHKRLQSQDVHFLDAPVSGGPKGAELGQLAILVGGEKAAFDKYKPVLEKIGDKVQHVGDIGAGTIVKLVHNMASVAMMAVTAEALTLGGKAGIDPLELWKAMRTGVAGQLRSFDNAAKRYLPGKFDPATFALELSYKDTALALEMADDLKVPMAICRHVQSDMLEALNKGWGLRDAHSFLALQNARAGVDVFSYSNDAIAAAMAHPDKAA